MFGRFSRVVLAITAAAALVTAVAAAAATPTAAAQGPNAIDLGTLGGTFSAAADVNARGQVVGDLDPTFGAGGVVTTDFGASESGEAMTLLPDGRIVVVGGLNPDSDGYDSDEFVVARYSTEGLLDPTFDGDGRVTTDVGGPRDEAFAVAAQPDGKILAGGWAGPSLAFALVRYTTAGSLDPEFGGGDGKVATSFGASYGAIHDLALQPDGKIVAVGGQCGVESCDVALARYLTDGAPIRLSARTASCRRISAAQARRPLRFKRTARSWSQADAAPRRAPSSRSSATTPKGTWIQRSTATESLHRPWRNVRIGRGSRPPVRRSHRRGRGEGSCVRDCPLRR